MLIRLLALACRYEKAFFPLLISAWITGHHSNSALAKISSTKSHVTSITAILCGGNARLGYAQSLTLDYHINLLFFDEIFFLRFIPRLCDLNSGN